MSSSPPEVDRVAASRAAVAARRARAAVKAALRAGTRSPRSVLAAAWSDHASAEASLRVTEFLLSLPAVGERKLERILERLAISPRKRLGGLGGHQRERLAAFVDSWRPGRRHGRARLTVLAGPTAVGKGTVAAYIREHYPKVHLSVSATTRPPRPGEVDGVHYYFVSDAEFDRLIAEGELLEWATVHNASRYGTPRRPVLQALERGQQVLLEIDLQGARQVRTAMPEARLVFLAPPSWDELVRRLVGRGTETDEQREARLRTAKVELAARDEFDAVVVNDTIESAAAQIVELMDID